jgi:predicted nucleic acid-binding protein
MKIFFDTNILLDIIEQRAPHFQSSREALLLCDERGDEMIIAWHSISNAFYIYAKKAGQEKANEALEDTLSYMTVATVGQTEALKAFQLGLSDLEDAMQVVSAEAAAARYFITRDPSGFVNSPIAIISPEEFVARFSEQL